MTKQNEKKDPLLCRLLGHDWQRYKPLDKSPSNQACKCKRCGRVMYLG